MLSMISDGKTVKYFCAKCHEVYSISRQDMFDLNQYSFTFGGDKVKEFINKVTRTKFTKLDDIIRVHYCPICHKYPLNTNQLKFPKECSPLSFQRHYDEAYEDYQRIVKRISEEDIDFENYYNQAEPYIIDGKIYNNAIVKIKKKKEESPIFDKDCHVCNEAAYNALINVTADTLKGLIKGTSDNEKEDDDMSDIVTNDNKSVSIFTRLNGVDIDLSKLKKIIYIDEFTGIKTEYDITKIELTYDGVTIHVDAGEKHRSVKIRYDRYNDTDYSMLELVTPDTLSFVRRV